MTVADKKPRNYRLEHKRRIKLSSAIGYCYDCGEESKMYFRCEKHRKRINKRRGLSGKTNGNLHL